MKSGLCALFSFIILTNALITLSVKFEYTTVSKTANQNNNRFENVIKSYSTPLKLFAVKDFNDRSLNSNKNRELSFKSLDLVSSNTTNNENDSKLYIPERFKEQEGTAIYQTTLETPEIIPRKAANTISSSNYNNNNTSNANSNKQDEFGFDIDLQNRLNDASLQTISDKEALNAIYPDPEVYKEKMKVKVFDPNFESIKNSFEAKLEKLLEKGLTEKPIQHVDEINKPFNKINISSEDFPSINADSLSQVKGRLNKENSNVFETSKRKGNLKQ